MPLPPEIAVRFLDFPKENNCMWIALRAMRHRYAAGRGTAPPLPCSAHNLLCIQQVYRPERHNTMARKVLIFFIILFSLALIGEGCFIAYQELRPQEQVMVPSEPSTSTAAPTETTAATTLPTEAETTAATMEATTAPTETEPVETEPTEQRFVLTFAGDCTMGATPTKYNADGAFIKVIGENYDFPFDNVRDIFEADDFTMVNLEGVFMDETGSSSQRFPFRGPTAYTQILTGSSVEAVTLANNHTQDFGSKGYDSTTTALEEAGVTYVGKNDYTVFTTESGLTIGLYAVAFDLNQSDMKKDFAALREAGAEIIVVAIHWGEEGAYRPSSKQVTNAHALIDAGADIVYGHHPHVLQKIEEYGDGIIYYSLGNFSFGGNTFPRDMDSAILQQEIIRDVDGTVRLGELTILPCSISSMKGQNNYQPKLYEEGTTEYDRTLSKLDGSFKGADLVVNYEDPTTATEAPATEAPATQAPTQAPADPQPEAPTPTEAPAPAPTEAPAPAPTEAPAPAPTQAPAAPESGDAGGAEG